MADSQSGTKKRFPVLSVEHHLPERRYQTDPCSNDSTGNRNLCHRNSGHPAVYPAVHNHGTGCKTGTEPFSATPASGSVGTSDDPDTCICDLTHYRETEKAGAQIPLPPDEGSPHTGSVCGDHGTVCDRTGCNPGAGICPRYL